MSLPSSLQSYQDCYDFFDKISDDPKGGRVFRGTYEAAFNWRQRAHYFRRLDREENTRLYQPGDPMYGKSAFDPFRLTIRKDSEGFYWVYAERVAIADADIELLSEIDDTVEVSDGQAAE